MQFELRTATGRYQPVRMPMISAGERSPVDRCPALPAQHLPRSIGVWYQHINVASWPARGFRPERSKRETLDQDHLAVERFTGETERSLARQLRGHVLAQLLGGARACSPPGVPEVEPPSLEPGGLDGHLQVEPLVDR
jgi:hypothetical protein